MIRNPGRLISILYRKGQVFKNINLKKYEITASEQPFLSALFFEDGVSQDLLSKYLFIDKASTARAIKSLIKKGYVVKIKDEDDKRINRIFLTEKAKNSKENLFEVLDNWKDVLTSDMDEDEKEIAYLYLNRMVSNVENYIQKKKNELER